MKGMGNMMKQAQKLQTKMLKLQEELADKSVESTSGGGMVRVVANGRQQVLSITIDKEVGGPRRRGDAPGLDSGGSQRRPQQSPGDGCRRNGQVDRRYEHTGLDINPCSIILNPYER